MFTAREATAGNLDAELDVCGTSKVRASAGALSTISAAARQAGTAVHGASHARYVRSCLQVCPLPIIFLRLFIPDPTGGLQ